MISSPQESWGLKGFWIKSKGFGVKMEEKKEQAYCAKALLLSLLLFYYYLYVPVIQSVHGKELLGVPWDLERHRNGVS